MSVKRSLNQLLGIKYNWFILLLLFALATFLLTGIGDHIYYYSADKIIPLSNILSSLDCSVINTSDDVNESSSFLTEASIIKRTRNCDSYFKIMPTVAFDPPTRDEEILPLAFAFTVHKDIAIFELFLALYYRPSDAHCIHVDHKSSVETLSAVQHLVGCYKKKFPQATIFIAAKSIPVFWGYGGSIMEADMICYRELKERSKMWKMVSNVAGTELPFVSHQKFREVLIRAGGNVLDIKRNEEKYRQKNVFEIKR